jgi:hypothetical protein
MAMETPLIATDVGGRELAHPDVHGLIIPNHDRGALRAAIEAVMPTPAPPGFARPPHGDASCRTFERAHAPARDDVRRADRGARLARSSSVPTHEAAKTWPGALSLVVAPCSVRFSCGAVMGPTARSKARRDARGRAGARRR